jgi:hypothetical protein
MKVILITILILCGCNAHAIDKVNHLSIGLDLSQFYYFTNFKPRFNGAVIAQYKPCRFLAFNASCFINNIQDERRFGYSQLKDYENHGTCFKGGFDGSVRISRNREFRAFMGLQAAAVSFRESGRFELDNGYWGHHQSVFSTPSRTYGVGELNMGLQFMRKKWIFRPQFYMFLAKDDKKVSYHNDVNDGYRSPFVPGYGYNRRGVNFILMYSLGDE